MIRHFAPAEEEARPDVLRLLRGLLRCRLRENARVIYEPMTVLTDYVLAAFAIGFAIRLWRANRAWSLAFFFTAAGAVVGGTFHAVAPRLSAAAGDLVWLATVLLIGAASGFLLSGLGRAFAVFAAVKFAAYAVWVSYDPQFLVVIADYGTSLLIVAILHAVRWSAASRWVLAGVATAGAAAVIQGSGFTLHRHLNHNDLYHLVQIAALWMLYRGGLRRSVGSLGHQGAIDGRAVAVTSSSAR